MSTLLRMATAGSVDDGKSTLVGRLLRDTKSVLSDQLAAVEKVSRDRGLAETDLALLTDGLRAEREQGITIDVAYRYFATPARSFVLADCPGHVQYTRNAVTGFSTADLVVLLLDARRGIVEQTCRHLAVAALMRVPHVVVAVNKIDLVDHDETTQPFRMPVQLVVRSHGTAVPQQRDYRGYAGRISTGQLAVGDRVAALPSGTESTVVGIDIGESELGTAACGQSVSVRLADDMDISRGDVLVAATAVPDLVRELAAVVCWLGDTPLRRGARVQVKHGTRTVSAIVDSVDAVLDLDRRTWTPAESLALNDIGQVRLRLAAGLPIEPYRRSRPTGAFLVIDPYDGATLAAGMAQ